AGARRPPRRRVPRRHHLPLAGAVRARARGLLRRDLDRGHGRRARALRRALPRADVRRHGRLPPLLLAPHLQDEPRLPVHPGAARAEHHAEGGDVVGGQAPPPPQARRHGRRRALAAAARLLVLALGVDLRPQARRHRPRGGARPGEVPRAHVARPVREGARHRAGRGLLRLRRLARADRGLHVEHGARVPRHLHDQLARPRARHAALRHGRRLAQQLVARDRHAGRGVAQQPPRLHGEHAPGLPLVRVRPHVLRAQGAVVGGRGVGAQRAARRHREQREEARPRGGGQGGAAARRQLPRGAHLAAGARRLGADAGAPLARRAQGARGRRAGQRRARGGRRPRRRAPPRDAPPPEPRRDPPPGAGDVRAHPVARRDRGARAADAGRAGVGRAAAGGEPGRAGDAERV
ncbi:MAG: Fatty acid desaturase; Delta-9 fatty acid desaturase, partial [uncultured Gemmatimonadaceae bacterium]